MHDCEETLHAQHFHTNYTNFPLIRREKRHESERNRYVQPPSMQRRTTLYAAVTWSRERAQSDERDTQKNGLMVCDYAILRILHSELPIIASEIQIHPMKKTKSKNIVSSSIAELMGMENIWNAKGWAYCEGGENNAISKGRNKHPLKSTPFTREWSTNKKSKLLAGFLLLFRVCSMQNHMDHSIVNILGTRLKTAHRAFMLLTVCNMCSMLVRAHHRFKGTMQFRNTVSVFVRVCERVW